MKKAGRGKVGTKVGGKIRSRKQIAWTVVAILFLLGFCSGLGLRIYGGHETTRHTGPDHLVAAAGKVYVHANGNLWVLTDIGDTLLRLQPDQLKLSGSVTDLRIMPDGRLLIAERRPARISLCDTDTWSCQPIKAPIANKLENQFKVLPAPDGNTLYVTDSTRKGPLYAIDISAGTIKPILEKELTYANDIQMAADGLLWVADSGHHRIVQLKLDGDHASLTGFPFSAKNKASTGSRTWPMKLQALASGEWAVTQPGSRGGPADILIYKDAQTPERRLPLASGLDPTDLTVANGWLLATDISGYALYTIDTGDGRTEPWGDQRFSGWLNEQRTLRDKYQRWVDGGLVVMILCAPFMLLAGYYGTPRAGRKQVFQGFRPIKLEASPAEVPPLSSVHWLKRNRKMDLLFRFLPMAITTLVVLVLGMTGYLLFTTPADNLTPEALANYRHLFFIACIVMLGMLPMVYLNLRLVRGQLGTDGQRIYVRYPGGTQASAPANKIVYTAYLLRFGRDTLSVGANRGQALYDKGEIETYIAPLLKHGKKVSIAGLILRQVIAGEPGPIYTQAYLTALVAALIYFQFFS